MSLLSTPAGTGADATDQSAEAVPRNGIDRGEEVKNTEQIGRDGTEKRDRFSPWQRSHGCHGLICRCGIEKRNTERMGGQINFAELVSKIKRLR